MNLDTATGQADLSPRKSASLGLLSKEITSGNN